MAASHEAERVLAVDGWFTTGSEPHLIGTRCESCGTYFFPPTTSFCRNPACDGTDLRETRLSRLGTVWSYTVNHYPPPPPFVPTEPFEPYTVAAVELSEERMIVLGQVTSPTANLSIGDRVELVVDTLFRDDGREHLVWKWKPL